jgi:hypothetical protein
MDGEKITRVSLKNVPATTRKVHSDDLRTIKPQSFEPALLQGRAAGVGQPFTSTADCRLPISDWKLADDGDPNRQSEIGNWQ